MAGKKLSKIGEVLSQIGTVGMRETFNEKTEMVVGGCRRCRCHIILLPHSVIEILCLTMGLVGRGMFVSRLL